MSDEPDRWIVIPRWPEFQHYRNRDPSWIKNQVSMLHSDEYRRCTLAVRGLYHGCMLEYAASHGQLRGDAASLTRLLGQRVTDAQLERLNHAGLIEFSASKPPAMVASPEKRRVKEKSVNDDSVLANSPLFVAPTDNGSGEFVCPVGHCRITKPTQKLLAEHLENVHGQAP
jgi:hypothetical protein